MDGGLERWGEGKPVGFVILARTLVQSADSVFEFLKLLQQAKPPWELAIPDDVDDWISLYRDHRRVERIVIDGLFPMPEEPFSVSQCLRGSRNFLLRLSKWSPDRRRRLFKRYEAEIMQGMIEMKPVFEDMLRTSTQENWDEVLGPVEECDFDRVMQTLEARFFLEVWFPCLIHYGEYPATIYRRACQGESESIQILARLDKWIFSDKRIQRHWIEASCKSGNRFRKMCDALKGRPRTIKKSKFKARLMSLFVRMAELTNVDLSVSECEQLFHAVEMQRSGRDRDPDIPLTPDSVRKAISRDRRHWSMLPAPDKIKS